MINTSYLFEDQPDLSLLEGLPEDIKNFLADSAFVAYLRRFPTFGNKVSTVRAAHALYQRLKK